MLFATQHCYSGRLMVLFFDTNFAVDAGQRAVFSMTVKRDERGRS